MLEGKNSALEVETAAYALLALLKEDPVKHAEDARKIVRYLTSKQNGQGGFVSTQVSLEILEYTTCISLIAIENFLG